MAAELLKQGAQADKGHVRHLLIGRGPEYPTREEMLVACPAVVAEKSRVKFEENWGKITEALGLFEGQE